MIIDPIIEKIQDLGYQLPEPPKPVGSYVPGLLSANQIFVSGQLPLISGKLIAEGKLGDTIDEATAIRCAQQCTLNALSIVNSLLEGNLSRIKQVIFVRGYISCTPEYTSHPKILNGVSDLLVAILGESGKHARAVLGVPSLPLNSPIEVEIVFSY